eukprot:jgi/Hompol1/5764/HPOL_004706-RA
MWLQLGGYIKLFARSQTVISKCVTYGIESSVVIKALQEFRSALITGKLPSLTMDDLLAHFRDQSRDLTSILMPQFYAFLQKTYPNECQSLNNLIESSDLRSPPELYPEARKIKRTIVMHVGPTNSGKTHAALERFRLSESGIYCGPLRLLAHEVYQRTNSAGVPCNLLTGEERRQSDGVNKWSCTVEMTIMNRVFDVAVLDEIQMIGDTHRGWAWTQALLGIQAKEIHLCGEPSAVDIVRKLCASTEDELIIKTYERLTPLTVMSRSLEGRFNHIHPGDAIITFSRKSIFSIKHLIETNTPYRAAIIYGSLPPESRAEQARLFNDPNSDFPILVASDAIGMGLNLNIRRVVFWRVDKFDGEKTIPLTVSQIKQIAGRAGRFKTQYDHGKVTTFQKSQLAYLQSQMAKDSPKTLAAGIMPTIEQLEQFSKSLPNDTLMLLLTKFEDLAQMDGNYFMCNLDTQRELAYALRRLPMSLRDRYTFVQSPCNPDDEAINKAFLKMAKAHSEQREIGVQSVLTHKLMIDGANQATTSDTLKELETAHRIVILYLWLSIRFPTTFSEHDEAMALKQQLESVIDESLINFRPARQRDRSSSRPFKSKSAGAQADSTWKSNNGYAAGKANTVKKAGGSNYADTLDSEASDDPDPDAP